MEVREELSILIRSRQSLISVVTGEEERGRELIRGVCENLGQRQLFFWNSMTGFRMVGPGSNPLEEGRMDEALAGSTPYLRQFGLAAGGCYLAKSGLADGDAGRVGMSRFFVENFTGECSALKQTVTSGAESLLAAGKLLKTG